MNDSFDLDKFVQAVEAQQTFNLPLVAKSMGISWEWLKPQLKRGAPLRKRLEQVYEESRYRIMDNYFKEASGVGAGHKLPPITTLRYLFNLIDSGAVFGDPPPEQSGGGELESEEDIKQRLGLTTGEE